MGTFKSSGESQAAYGADKGAGKQHTCIFARPNPPVRETFPELSFHCSGRIGDTFSSGRGRVKLPGVQICKRRDL